MLGKKKASGPPSLKSGGSPEAVRPPQQGWSEKQEGRPYPDSFSARLGPHTPLSQLEVKKERPKDTGFSGK